MERPRLAQAAHWASRKHSRRTKGWGGGVAGGRGGAYSLEGDSVKASVVEKLNEPRIVSYMSSSLYTPPLSSPETLRRKGSRLLVSDASSITMYVGAVAKVDASRLASATRGRVPQWCQRAAWRVFGRRRTCERQPRGQEGKEGADPRHPRSPRQREPRPPRFLGRRRQRLASQNIYMRVCYLQAVLFPVVVVVVAVKPVVLPPWDTTTDTRGERTLALATGKRTLASTVHVPFTATCPESTSTSLNYLMKR